MTYWKTVLIKQINNYKRLDSGIHRDHLQAQSIDNPVEKWAKYLNRPFTKDINVHKYMKSCSTSITCQRNTSYWTGQKVHFGFSVRSYGKSHMNSWANPIKYNETTTYSCMAKIKDPQTKCCQECITT